MADGVDQRRRAADGACFATALHAQRVVRAGRALDGFNGEVAEVVGARHRVVHVAAGEQLTAFGVVDTVLHQRLPQALRHAAVHLPVHDHRVDDVAEVVAGGEAVHAHHTRGWVDFHLADVGACRVGEVAGVVEGVLVQARFQLVVGEVVRHVGRQADAGKGHALVGAGDLEHAVLKQHVGVGRFHQVRRYFLAFGDDLVECLDDGRAADCQRSAAVSAHAEEDLAGVTMLDVDVFQRDTELVGHDLREGRLVALAVAVAAGEDRHLASGVHAHLTGFEKARAGAERTRHAGRRNAAGFDVRAVAQSAFQTLGFRSRLARFEATYFGQFDRARHGGFVVAGVVRKAYRRGVGEGLDEVAAAQLGRVDAQFTRGRFHDALDRVGGLGPAGAAVSVDGRGIREHRCHRGHDLRRGVLAGQQRGVEDRWHRAAKGAEVSAQVGRGVDLEGDELAVLVQPELGRGEVVAAMGVGQKRLTPVGRPLDGPLDVLRGEDQRRFFTVEKDLAAEAATDVGCDDAHLVFRNAQHKSAHQEPLDVRVLVGNVQRVAVVGRAVDRIGGTRLDRVGHQAVVAKGQRGDVRGLGERFIYAGGVADLPLKAPVTRCVVMHVRACGGDVADVDDGRQHLVVDVDQRGGGLGLLQRFSHDQRHAVADIAHFGVGNDRVLGLLHRRAVDVVDEPAARQTTHSLEMFAGEDTQHAVGLGRGCGVQRLDGGVCMRAAQKVAVGLAMQRDVVGVLADTGEKALIFAAEHALADKTLSCVHVRTAPVRPWPWRPAGPP